jgi:DNA polymerase I-like protein with 3'-5' exonuclease and polymerase domains
MLPASDFLTDMEDNGVPLDKDLLIKARDHDLADEIFALEQSIYEFKAIQQFEMLEQVRFNANSVQHLRKVFFEILDLPIPEKVTGTGAISTDKEVLEELSAMHPLPKLILELKQLKKIKSTYIDKMLMHIDSDSRLRTGFNLCTTTSGRLSSSGTINLQQLPRDSKVVKRAIKARPGYKIVSQDLATAEMYVAAVLSGDLVLQDVFVSGGDFHSSIAKKVFKLNCLIEEVKNLYKRQRQSSKAVSFGILFGAGKTKIAQTAEIPESEAEDVISEYFRTFNRLKSWMDSRIQYIKTYGATYSVFGRKRRLKNVFSDNREIVGHASRSGFNFEIQSVASDLNLLAAIDLNNWVKTNNKDIKIFALVHDSIVAEVREDLVEEYCSMMKFFTQKDRGCSIPNCPIGIDQEIGDSYAFEDSK